MIKPLAFQKNDINVLKNIIRLNGGGFVFNDTGLGKTIISLLTIKDLANENSKLLVISPKTHFGSWENHIKNIGIKNYTICTHKKITNGAYDFIIIDEAHRLNNSSSKGYLDYMTLLFSGKIPTVIALTATPYNNNLTELFTLLSLVPYNTNSPFFYIISALKNIINNSEKVLNNLKIYVGEDNYSYRDINELTKHESIIRTHLDILIGVLPFISIRTTRDSIKNDENNDDEIKKSFPIINTEPIIEYDIDDESIKLIDKINKLLKYKLKYARHNVFKYVIEEKYKENYLDTSSLIRTFFFKRMDSSFYAFRESIKKQVELSKDILKNKRGNIIKINKEDFGVVDGFYTDVEHDIVIFEEILEIASKLSDDYKINAVIEKALKQDKVIIFTEYNDTLHKIKEILDLRNVNNITFTHESGDKELDMVESEFNPNISKKIQTNNIKILLTTDILSEGQNLHRANAVIHFDNKWNPSRTKQRNGRIDRITINSNNTQENNTKSIFFVKSIPYIDDELNLSKIIENKEYYSNYIFNENNYPNFNEVYERLTINTNDDNIFTQLITDTENPENETLLFKSNLNDGRYFIYRKLLKYIADIKYDNQDYKLLVESALEKPLTIKQIYLNRVDTEFKDEFFNILENKLNTLSDRDGAMSIISNNRPKETFFIIKDIERKNDKNFSLKYERVSLFNLIANNNLYSDIIYKIFNFNKTDNPFGKDFEKNFNYYKNIKQNLLLYYQEPLVKKILF